MTKPLQQSLFDFDESRRHGDTLSTVAPSAVTPLYENRTPETDFTSVDTPSSTSERSLPPPSGAAFTPTTVNESPVASLLDNDNQSGNATSRIAELASTTASTQKPENRQAPLPDISAIPGRFEVYKLADLNDLASATQKLSKARAELDSFGKLPSEFIGALAHLIALAPVVAVKRPNGLEVIGGLITLALLKVCCAPTAKVAVLVLTRTDANYLLDIALADYLLRPLAYGLSHRGIKRLMRFFSEADETQVASAHRLLPEVRGNKDFERITGIREATIYRQPKTPIVSETSGTDSTGVGESDLESSV